MVKYISLTVLVLLNVSYIMSKKDKEDFMLRKTSHTEKINMLKKEGIPMRECPVSIYVVVLMAIIIISMLILISFLTYALYKTKLNVYKKTITTNTETTIGKVDQYVRQDSHGVGEFSTLRKMSTLDSPFKCSETVLTVVSGMNTNVNNETNYNTENENTTKSNTKPKVPINKRNYPVQALILPAQMDKICKDVLSKMNRNESMSLTHLNEIINEEVKEKPTFKLSANEKCASLSVIDDRSDTDENNVEYDVLPQRPVPLSSVGSCEELINSVYDFVPHQSNRGVSDADGNYKILLSNQGPFKEPSYVNAKEQTSTRSSLENEQVIYEL